MAERRPERVGHLVQSELARLLIRDVKDPRLRLVTVTAVKMTPDLRVARVYVRTLEESADHGDVIRGLQRAAPFLRGQVGRALGLRVTPELRFEWDALPDTARRLDELLRAGARRDDDET